MIKASSLSMKMELPKALYGLGPALIASPAFASVDVSSFLSTYLSLRETD